MMDAGGFWQELWHVMSQYYGVDWLITLTVFAGLFLIGDKKVAGFILGMASASFAFIFSFQIASVANGVTAVVLFVLYLRGYLKWRRDDALAQPAGV